MPGIQQFTGDLLPEHLDRVVEGELVADLLVDVFQVVVGSGSKRVGARLVIDALPDSCPVVARDELGKSLVRGASTCRVAEVDAISTTHLDPGVGRINDRDLRVEINPCAVHPYASW